MNFRRRVRLIVTPWGFSISTIATRSAFRRPGKDASAYAELCRFSVMTGPCAALEGAGLRGAARLERGSGLRGAHQSKATGSLSKANRQT